MILSLLYYNFKTIIFINVNFNKVSVKEQSFKIKLLEKNKS